MIQLPFRDRLEAGRFLGAELARRAYGPNPIVLALPRGGVPLGQAVADALKAPLDVVIVRKLGVPWQPELAMGAIAGDTRVLDFQLIRDLRIPDEEIEKVVRRETEEWKRRERLYRGGQPAPNLAGRTVFLVDDGLATGSTMSAAARHVRSQQPGRLVIAVPVGSSEACHRLKKEADDCVCLATPEPFYAVGEWYLEFGQVSDDQVCAVLQHYIAQPERHA